MRRLEPALRDVRRQENPMTPLGRCTHPAKAAGDGAQAAWAYVLPGFFQFHGSSSSSRDSHSPSRYSINSSARTRSDGGIVIPSFFAVQLLMTNSNRVACRSGTSLGRAPAKT